MQLTIEIDIKTVKDGKRVKETRTYERDFDDLPLILVESLESEAIHNMRLGIAEYLDLSEDEAKQLTLRHVRQFTAAISQAREIPNG